MSLLSSRLSFRWSVAPKLQIIFNFWSFWSIILFCPFRSLSLSWAGLYIISQCLSPVEQLAWCYRCVRQFSILPYTNLSNLGGSQPNHWQEAVHNRPLSASVPDLAVFRSLRWANLGFAYDWTARAYTQFRRSHIESDPAKVAKPGEESGLSESVHGFPPDLGALGRRLANLVGENLDPESGIVNFYSTLSSHMGVLTFVFELHFPQYVFDNASVILMMQNTI